MKGRWNARYRKKIHISVEHADEKSDPKLEVHMVEKLLKALGVEVSEVESSSMAAIPFNEARLCINCEHIVRNSVCPTCGSKSHMLLGNVLGLINN